MIDKSIFDRMDALAAEVGPDPHAITDRIGARITPAYGTINGMVAYAGRRHRIALNEQQPGYQYIFCHHHENTHVVEGHLSLPGFLNELGFHMDIDTFSREASRHMISYSEMVCNLNAARLMFDGEEILKMTGYYAFEQLREARKDLWKARGRLEALQESLRYNSSSLIKCKYAEAKKELKEDYDRLMDLGSEYSCIGFMTVPQVAQHYGVPEHYIEYALEAQRILGADLDVQEIRSFEKMFTRERMAAGEGW